MNPILRSMLYVPANSWRMINNATNEGADAVILDLEDGCPISEKETGRIFARDSIQDLKAQNVNVFVRVNSIETELTLLDITTTVIPGLDGIMLAKTETAKQVAQTAQLIEEEEEKKHIKPGSVKIIPLIETPRAIINLTEIIQASERVIAIAFGAGDYSREMGAGMGVTSLHPDDYFTMVLYARSAMATAARAFGINAIDTPFFGFVIDLEGLKVESERVKRLGFSGKQLTHPRHVAVANDVFAPAKDDVDLAKKVVAAYEEALSKGLGATTLGGKMIDYGSYKRAKALLDFAQAIQHKKMANE